jgi:hypothetical protein
MHPTAKPNASCRVAQAKHPAKVSPMDSRQLLSECHRAGSLGGAECGIASRNVVPPDRSR